MADEISNQVENQATPVEGDPWAAAFAAIDQASSEASQADTDSGEAGGAGLPVGAGSDTVGGSLVPNQAQAGDGAQDAGAAGGLDTSAERVEDEGSSSGGSLFERFGTEDVEKYRSNMDERIRNKAIDDVAKEFVKRGIRNRNGKLGATIDDSDVCKRDENGVPHFYNPETGQEFRGDNPRRQAQEWVDDYNKDLERVFNETCEKYENHLRQTEAPSLAVIEFAPKYEKLDDIRKGMFDNVIEDYEVRDKDGKLVGYSCDLDKALALVERQIAMIQNYAKSHQQQQQQQPSGPALDMKTSSGAIQVEDKPVSSLAEAMERLQDRQLAKLKR